MTIKIYKSPINSKSQKVELVKKLDKTYSIIRVPGAKCDGVKVLNSYLK